MLSFSPPGTYRPFLPFIAPALLPLMLTFMGGIIAAYFHYYWSVPLILSIPSLITIMYNNHVSKKSFLYALFFVIGFFRTDFALKPPCPIFPLWHSSIEASVDNITFSEDKTWRYQTILKVKRFFKTEKWEEKTFTLLLYSSKHPFFKIGDTVHCALDHIVKPEGGFKLYLSKEGVDATAFQQKVSSKIIKRPPYSFKRWMAQKRKSLYRSLLKKMDKSTFSLFSSLFLGNRTSVKKGLESQKPLFKLWGITHFLARSGLHLLLFIAMLQGILRYIPAHFLIKQTSIVCITLIYFLFSWTSISFNRAFYTFLFYQCSVFLNIPVHSMHAISLICLILLLINPLQLFFLDFQFTFLLTFCLIWIAHTRQQRRLLYPQSIAELKKKILS